MLQVSPTKETLLAWQNRPQRLVAKFIKQELTKDVPVQNRNTNAVTSVEKNFQNLKLEEKNFQDRQHCQDSIASSPCISTYVRSNSRSTSESSLGEIDSYEDETIASKKFTGKTVGDRVRIDSMSQIASVRFDDPN